MLLVCIVVISCRSGGGSEASGRPGISLDSLFRRLEPTGRLNRREIAGRFSYEDTTSDDTLRYANFSPADTAGVPSVMYVRQMGEGPDSIRVKGEGLVLRWKLDPLTMRVGWVLDGRQKKLVFVGEAISSSPNARRQICFLIGDKEYEFQSRFGGLGNLIDYNNDGWLDYYQIEPGTGKDVFRLTVQCPSEPGLSGNGGIDLHYEGEGKFTVLHDDLKGHAMVIPYVDSVIQGTRVAALGWEDSLSKLELRVGEKKAFFHMGKGLSAGQGIYNVYDTTDRSVSVCKEGRLFMLDLSWGLFAELYLYGSRGDSLYELPGDKARGSIRAMDQIYLIDSVRHNIVAVNTSWQMERNRYYASVWGYNDSGFHEVDEFFLDQDIGEELDLMKTRKTYFNWSKRHSN